MISTEEAKRIISGNSRSLPSRSVPISEAAGLILAKDVYAPLNIPAFPQSGMDGYALAFSSIGAPIAIAGEQAAGSNLQTTVQPGTAVRIFTGAVVPPGADTVVIQEKATVLNGFLHIEDDKLKPGDNVRPPGSEIAKDELALPAGSLLTPPAIGFLAGMGITMVEAIPAPRVSIIVTGNELQPPGTAPEFGKVYESNSFALLAAMRRLHIHETAVHQAADDPETLTRILQEAVTASDVVLMTGGVSAGDYDFTVKVSENCGIQKIFHKIRQKPGKPFFFGKKHDLLFFGLPGNPASVLTCFYEYVMPALGKLMAQETQMKTMTVPLAVAYKKPAGITHYLKGIYNGRQVQLPTGQESYKLNSFARANCLVVIPEPVTEIMPGENIEIHLLP